MAVVFVGLGSNWHNPQQQILTAFTALTELPKTQVIKTSDLYCSKPWGGVEQPDFINAVVKIRTLLNPQTLLQALLAIEQKHYRVRTVRFGPRTLDCDLLLYGQRIIEEQNLRIPHPYMHQRAFVLVPLNEIEPHLVFPTGERIVDLIEQCDDKESVKRC